MIARPRRSTAPLRPAVGVHNVTEERDDGLTDSAAGLQRIVPAVIEPWRLGMIRKFDPLAAILQRFEPIEGRPVSAAILQQAVEQWDRSASLLWGRINTDGKTPKEIEDIKELVAGVVAMERKAFLENLQLRAA